MDISARNRLERADEHATEFWRMREPVTMTSSGCSPADASEQQTMSVA